MIVSIDLWGTLIKPNPLFKAVKVELVKKYFKHLNEYYILECFEQSKKQLNLLIENTGFQPDIEVIFNVLIQKLNGAYKECSFINEFISDYQNIDIKYIEHINIIF